MTTLSSANHGVALSPRMGWVEFEKAVPGAVAALSALGKAVESTGLDKALSELVNVRVSQINGCAFCLKLHLDWARQAGVSPVLLGLVSVWRDVSGFDPRQRAALAWAECLTRMAADHVSDEDFGEARGHFSEVELAALTAAVAGINAWNRMAGSLRFAPPGL